MTPTDSGIRCRGARLPIALVLERLIGTAAVKTLWMNKTVNTHVDCATGALGLGWLSTWFLSGTLEDLLALGLAAAVAYVSVVNLPLKRREAKDRLHELCSDFVQVRIP